MASGISPEVAGRSPGIRHLLVQLSASLTASAISGQCLSCGALGSVTADHIRRGISGPFGPLQVSQKQETYLISVFYAGLMVGAGMAGWYGQKDGSRKVILVTYLLLLPSWLVFCLAHTVLVAILGRFLLGTSIGFGTACNFVFISGIASPTYRGLLVTFSVEANSLFFGILTFMLSRYLAWWKVGLLVGVPASLLSLLIVCSLPSDPVWLINQGSLDEAHRSLAFYRGPGGNLNQMKRPDKANACEIDQARPDEITACENPLKKPDEVAACENPLQRPDEVTACENTLARSDEVTACVNTLKSLKLLADRQCLLPVLLCAGQLIMYVWSGGAVLQYYTVVFLRDMGLHMDPFLMSTLLVACRLPPAALSAWLVDRWGRRVVLVISSIGMAMCHSLLALQQVLPAPFDNLTLSVICLIGCMVFYIFGNSSVSWTLVGELLPSYVREIFGGGMVIYWGGITFLQMQFLPMMTSSMGLGGLFSFWVILSLLHVIFVVTVLPETNGLTTRELDQLFAKTPSKPSHDIQLLNYTHVTSDDNCSSDNEKITQAQRYV